MREHDFCRCVCGFVPGALWPGSNSTSLIRELCCSVLCPHVPVATPFTCAPVEPQPRGLGFSPRNVVGLFLPESLLVRPLPQVLRIEAFNGVFSKITYEGAQIQVFYLLGGKVHDLFSAVLFFAYLLYQTELSYLQIPGLCLIQKKCVIHHHILRNGSPFFFSLIDNGKCSDAKSSDP